MGASSSHHVSNPHAFLSNIYSDHSTIHSLFTSYKTSIRHEAQRESADRLVKELSLLLQTDDVTYIPVIQREISPGGQELASRLRQINRSIMEKCQEILFDLQNLEANLSIFHQHMNELTSLCEEHVAFEEKECLPRMQEQLVASQLDLINMDYNQTKTQAPSRPILGYSSSSLPRTAAGSIAGTVGGVGGAGGAGGAGMGAPAGMGTGMGPGTEMGTGMGVGPGYAPGTASGIVQGQSGALGIPGCGSTGSTGLSSGLGSGSTPMTYTYGCGNKAALLACRDRNDPNRPERVQGEYGSRS